MERIDILTKEVRVLLHSEDEAEQLKASLTKYKVSNVMIDFLDDTGHVHEVDPELQQELDLDSPVGAGETYTVGDADQGRSDLKPRTTVLTFETEEAVYEEVLEEIDRVGGQIDQALFE